ncbi:MAG: polyprenyl synthetase family protein [Bifidobacteriaceae bacterium]|jgi:heptaprenyl diphosphate synthase|nr:polyprenyl synthetase family protein [Bifidobacteriaceae bacterium]
MASLRPAIAVTDPALEAALEAGLEAVEAKLAQAVASPDQLVADASAHLLRSGGKRLRPLLVLATAQLGGGVNDQVVDAAVVVELTHLASLYHDDVMDDAPLRRGAPSAHEVYGPSVAILTGDLLFAKASQIVAGLGPAMVRLQAETFERLCLGQIHETAGPAAGEDPVAFHLRVLADKTGALIATSARFGAMLGGADRSAVAAVVGYGEAVGVAFQLADDIIDLTSPTEVTGKTPGTDLREGVPTMPGLLVEAAARRALDEGRADSPDVALAQAIAGDLSSDAALASVVERLRSSAALAEARQIARSWADRAQAELAPLPPGPVKQILADLADLFIRRLA